MSVPAIIQCQSCGEWKHVSWFPDGSRACGPCLQEGKSYVPFQLSEKARKHKDLVTAHSKTLITEWIENDTLPPDVTADERKILRLRALDNLSIGAASKSMGISEKRAAAIESRAQLKLARLSRDLATDLASSQN